MRLSILDSGHGFSAKALFALIRVVSRQPVPLHGRRLEIGKRARARNASRPDRLLRVAEVMKLTGLGRTTIWQLERDGRFPKPRKLADSRARAVAWRASEIARG